MAAKSDVTSEVIVLRSVYGKVGLKYYIMPCRDPKTGHYPTVDAPDPYDPKKTIKVEVVKRVDSHGDMIMSDQERNSGAYFIPETEVFIIEDGKTFNTADEVERRQWLAIKNCRLIAPERYAKDVNGNNLIDGTMGWSNKNPRYGIAELYVDKPGEEANRRVSKKKRYAMALQYIFDDPQGSQGRVLKARLLGKNMEGAMDTDVQDWLTSIAEKDPDKIINVYTGPDINLRLLLVTARDNKVIYIKNKLYMYADNIVLGATDDAVIAWMKDPKNKGVLELIRKDTYPEMYAKES